MAGIRVRATRRRSGTFLAALGLAFLAVAMVAPGVGAAPSGGSDPAVVQAPNTNGCMGVRTTPSSANTSKRLVGGTLVPGGTAVFEITYPTDGNPGQQTFSLTDCVFVDGDPFAKYFITFVPNTDPFVFQITQGIDASIPVGSEYCNYVKTTETPSNAQGSNRKAGPACFTVQAPATTTTTAAPTTTTEAPTTTTTEAPTTTTTVAPTTTTEAPTTTTTVAPTTTTEAPTTTTTAAPTTTTTVAPTTTTTVVIGGGLPQVSGVVVVPTTTTVPPTTPDPTDPAPGTPTTPTTVATVAGVVTPTTAVAGAGTETRRSAQVQGTEAAQAERELPRTGSTTGNLLVLAGLAFTLGGVALLFGGEPEPARRRA